MAGSPHQVLKISFHGDYKGNIYVQKQDENVRALLYVNGLKAAETPAAATQGQVIDTILNWTRPFLDENIDPLE